MNDIEKVALILDCAKKIDDGLAPLVAARIVKPGLANVLVSSLRVGIDETFGAPVGNKVILRRTLKAVKLLGKPAEDEDQIGGA